MTDQNHRLSPRVKEYRDSLRAERLRREEANGARTNPNAVDPWRQKNKPDEWEPQIQGVNDTPAAPSGNSSDPFADDDGFGPRADSQAKSGGDLHSMLEHAAEDDSLLLEAAQQSLQETRNETGAAAARTRRAAEQLVANIKDNQIAAIYKEFIVRSGEAGATYVPDDSSLNFVTLLEEVVRLTGANIYVDPDGDNTDEVGQGLFQRNLLNVDILLTAWKNIIARGDAPVLYEGQRPISESERRAAMVQAASGDVEGAIIALLQIALPSIGDASSPQEIYAAIGDPSNHDVLLDVVVSCWGATAAALAQGFRDTAENRQAIDDVLGERPITVDNVRQAWEEVKRSRRPASLPQQSAAAMNRAPSASDLDELADEEISDLLQAVTRDRSRRVRRGLL